MNQSEWKNLITDKIVYLDGAMGSNLIKRGMPKGVCPEKWILEHRDTVAGLQREYVRAGSDILYVPSFTANRIKLKEYGLEDQLEKINHDLVAITREAADSASGKKVYVCGDITMTGLQVKPMGKLDFEELVSIYKEQALALVEGGVDLFVIETMMSLQESRAALLAVKEVCNLPVMVTMTFEKDGRSLYGTDAETAAVVLDSLGADAIGANCSTGPEDMAEIIRSMAKYTNLPLIAKPNAGIPYLDKDGNTEYDNTAEKFAEEMALLAEAGATVLGGCCGSTPEYIAATVQKRYRPAERKTVKKERFLTTERNTFRFGLDDGFFVIGERINPTGKKTLQAELREGNMNRIFTFAEEQEENGARVLDVNLGMSGVDEKALMIRAIDELQEVTNLPLCIDTSHIDVCEAALRRYPGRALINSISYESEKFEKLLPIAKKYGAMFILLPLSDEGLPKSLDEKISIIQKVSGKALSMGFHKEDIIVDGLVATVGANKNAGVETLQTIQYCKQNGYATTCGLSNISFGLPERSYINAAFLAMMIQEGLTMAIANPNQTLLMNTAYACNLLKNRNEADIAYIEHINDLKEKGVLLESSKKNLTAAETEKKKTGALNSEEPEFPEEVKELYRGLLKGKKTRMAELTKKCLDAGHEASYLLNEVLIKGINEVGDLFEKGRYFLPQLIASAEAMEKAIAVLEPILQKNHDGKEMPVIVIATVSGDIHDIGKNLVALMLKNYGYHVIDLGKDVDKEIIVQTAIEENAEIIALSALMTTTMKEMENVVKLAKEKNCRAKVIIGGAVITEDYAKEIGASGYSKDASEAVKLVSKLLNLTA